MHSLILHLAQSPVLVRVLHCSAMAADARSACGLLLLPEGSPGSSPRAPFNNSAPLPPPPPDPPIPPPLSPYVGPNFSPDLRPINKFLWSFWRQAA